MKELTIDEALINVESMRKNFVCKGSDMDVLKQSIQVISDYVRNAQIKSSEKMSQK